MKHFITQYYVHFFCLCFSNNSTFKCVNRQDAGTALWSREKNKKLTAEQSNLNIYAYSFENQLMTKSEEARGRVAMSMVVLLNWATFEVWLQIKNLDRGFSQSRPILNPDCMIKIYNEVHFFLLKFYVYIQIQSIQSRPDQHTAPTDTQMMWHHAL